MNEYWWKSEADWLNQKVLLKKKEKKKSIIMIPQITDESAENKHNILHMSSGTERYDTGVISLKYLISYLYIYIHTHKSTIIYWFIFIRVWKGFCSFLQFCFFHDSKSGFLRTGFCGIRIYNIIHNSGEASSVTWDTSIISLSSNH